MAPTVDFGPVKYGCTKYKRRMVLYESVSHAGKRFEFCYSSSYRDKKGIETAYYKCVGCMHAKRYNDGRRIPKIAVRETRLVNSNPDRPSNFPHFCQPIDSVISERRQREREIANPQPKASKSESAGKDSNAGIIIINPSTAVNPSCSTSSVGSSKLSSYRAASYSSTNCPAMATNLLQTTHQSRSSPWFGAAASTPFGHSFASSSNSSSNTHAQLPPAAPTAFSSHHHQQFQQMVQQQQPQQHFEAANISNNNPAPSTVQTVQAVQQQIQQLTANCWFQPSGNNIAAAAAASQHFLLGVGMAAAAGGWPPPTAPVAAPIPSSRTQQQTTTTLLPHQPHRSC